MSPRCEAGRGHVYEGRTDRAWPFDGQWCLCRKRHWSWKRHKRIYGSNLGRSRAFSPEKTGARA